MASTAISNISFTAVVQEPPSLVEPSNPSQTEQKTSWGKAIKPPSMVLEEDINGFKSRNPKRSEKKGKHKKARYDILFSFKVNQEEGFRARISLW